MFWSNNIGRSRGEEIYEITRWTFELPANQHTRLYPETYFFQEWPNSLLRRNRDGIFPHDRRSREWGKEISPWITKGTLYFPHEWLSRNSENKFPHERRSREWGNFFLLWLLGHEWGKYYVPWVMNGEIYPSLFLLNMGFSFPCRERKLHHYEIKIVAELKNVFKYLEWWIGNISSHNFLKW